MSITKLLTVLVITSTIIAGCASQSEVDELRAEVAKSTIIAQDAVQLAEKSQSCCDANREALDRMYQRIMGK